MKDEKDGAVIPLNDRNPSLEDKVAHFLSTIPKLPRNERKPVRSRMPDSSDAVEQRTWCREELRRIREGHFGMSGKMYFWYNYVKLQDVESGTVRPEYRTCQAYWFDEILKAQNSREFGLIGVKRRRIGASWLETADVLHDAITRPGVKIGMTSKTEADAIELFKKVKFIYDNLPAWLRPSTLGGNTRMHMDFSYKEKDEKGNWVKRGSRSEILVKAPTDSAWEGFALAKYISDEAGKVANLKQLFTYTEPAMMKGTKRVGCPIIFGTAGDITKDGADFRDMFYNADTYKLKQFFFGGWMGLDGLVDEFGNDNEEEAIRWVIYERFRKEGLDKKTYNDFIQQYPLTIGEAFTSNETYGVGNSLKINKQINALTANPPLAKRGYFKLDTNQKPVFVPLNTGSCIIYEEPETLMDGLYLGGADTSDHEVKNPESTKTSGQCLFIMKKRKGTEPPKIVFEYYDKPTQPRDFYDQSLLALLYYGNAKVMIERNRYGMITYFDENGFKHLLATKPQGYSSLISGTTWNIGYYRDARTKKYGEECWAEYIDDYCDWIPSVGVLKESLVYGQQNTDRVASVCAAMIYLKEDKWEATPRASGETLFKKKLVRTASGGVKRVNY